MVDAKQCSSNRKEIFNKIFPRWVAMLVIGMFCTVLGLVYAASNTGDERLERKLDNTGYELNKINIRQAEMKSDIKHIRSGIDEIRDELKRGR